MQKLNVGDVVRVKGVGAELFTVEGMHHEHIFYKGESYEESVYMVKNVQNGLCYEVQSFDVKLVRAKDAPNSDTLKDVMIKTVIDEFLDEYNDMIMLYRTFADVHYANRANRILDEIKRLGY